MELPELTILSLQMSREMVGRNIRDIEVSNPKCLNMHVEQFRGSIMGKAVESVSSRGKWVFIYLSSYHVLLFNPGMGADVIHFRPGDKLPEKYHVKLVLDDDSGLTIRVWWFCYLHLMRIDKLDEHKLTAGMGLSPLDDGFTLHYFEDLLSKKKGNIKSFLLDQKNVAGIGNVYIQDMLFCSKVHPKRRISSLTEHEVKALYKSIRALLIESIESGGLAYEKDFYGNKGGYGREQFRIAYKPGEPCPVCRTPVLKIRTGSTSSFVCPNCQPLQLD